MKYVVILQPNNGPRLFLSHHEEHAIPVNAIEHASEFENRLDAHRLAIKAKFNDGNDWVVSSSSVERYISYVQPTD